MPMLHISPPGWSDEDTNAKIKLGRSHGLFRQCSIGYHEECSDPDGDECTCTCHSEGGAETRPTLLYEPIVCPYCGMSTWFQERCAMPGCEGSDG
jgi:hypothetical protein